MSDNALRNSIGVNAKCTKEESAPKRSPFNDFNGTDLFHDRFFFTYFVSLPLPTTSITPLSIKSFKRI